MVAIKDVVRDNSFNLITSLIGITAGSLTIMQRFGIGGFSLSESFGVVQIPQLLLGLIIIIVSVLLFLQVKK